MRTPASKPASQPIGHPGSPAQPSSAPRAGAPHGRGGQARLMRRNYSLHLQPLSLTEQLEVCRGSGGPHIELPLAGLRLGIQRAALVASVIKPERVHSAAHLPGVAGIGRQADSGQQWGQQQGMSLRGRDLLSGWGGCAQRWRGQPAPGRAAPGNILPRFPQQHTRSWGAGSTPLPAAPARQGKARPYKARQGMR